MKAWIILPVLLGGLLPLDAGAQNNWYRGNVHVHTNRSDGSAAPSVVIEWYRTHDYAFVVLTDHDLQSVTPELNGQFNSPGSFLLIPGVEVSDQVAGRPVHLNGLGATRAVKPQGGSDVPSVIDRDAAAIRKAGGIAVLNHPNGVLSAALSVDEIAASEIGLFEVCCADYLGGSGRPSTEEVWDSLLSRGHHMFGIAADDAHDFAPDSLQPGSAWIMVRATELTQPAILDAIQRGDFYATTGITLNAVKHMPGGLCLEIGEYDDFGFHTEFIGPGGRVLATDESGVPCFLRDEPPAYLRARVQRSDATFAWVQPVWFEQETEHTGSDANNTTAE